MGEVIKLHELAELWPVQEKALDMMRGSIRGGHKRPQLQLPTGSGKTVIAAHMVSGARDKGNRVAFVAPLISLIDQTFERFVENGVDPASMGVMQADHPMKRPHAPIQICSVQTLVKREFPATDFIIVYESHLQFKRVYEWMKLEPKKIFVGLSATPWAAGMAHHWDDLLIPATIKEMIALGHLCSCKTFAPTKPDLSGVRVEKGDYVEHELSDLMGQKAIIADVVATWLDRAQGLPTMVFAVDRAHAAKLTAEFASVGVRAAYVDALTAREERLAVKKLFATGDVQVICSVGTMTHGVDMDVRCISFCRPTKSPILYVQAVGRGLRTAPDKQHLLLLDHSNATLELGLVTDIGFSKLRGGNKEEKAKGSSKPMALLRPKECSRCGELVPAMVAKCEGCGYVMRVFSDVTTLDGELSEYDGTDSVKVQQMRSETRKAYTRPEKINFYAQLKWFGESKGYAEGWASHKYVEMFGCWPRDDSVPRATEPVKPHPTVLAWIRRRNLAWIHGKRRAQNAG